MTKAKVTTIPFGNYSFEGLLLADGTFAVGVSQVSTLFELNKAIATRTTKALLGGSFQLNKVSSELNPKKVNVLTLTEFTKVIMKLAFKGNEQAKNFAMLLIELSLEQLFSDAFGIKFEKEQRQAWLVERQNGKYYRRTLTDATKYLIDQGNKLDYGYITLSVYKGSGLLNAYRDYKMVHRDSKFRNNLSEQDLRRLAKMEELTADYVMVDKMGIEDAMERASTYIR